MIEDNGANGGALNDPVIMLGSGDDAKLYDGYLLGQKKHFIADADLPESFYVNAEDLIFKCELQGPKIVCDKMYGPYFNAGGNELVGALAAVLAVLGGAAYYADYVYSTRAAKKIEKSALTYLDLLKDLDNADMLTINDIDSSVERSEFYAGLKKIKTMPAGVDKPETRAGVLKAINEKGGVKLKGLLPSVLDNSVQAELVAAVWNARMMEEKVLSKINLTFPEPFYSDSALKKQDAATALLIIDSANKYAVGLNLFISSGMFPDDMLSLEDDYRSHKRSIQEMPAGIGDPTLQEEALKKIEMSGGVTLKEGSRFGLNHEMQVRLAEAVGNVNILRGQISDRAWHYHYASKMINSAAKYWDAMDSARYDPEGIDASELFSLKKTFYNDLQMIIEMPPGVGVEGEHDEAVDMIKKMGGVKLKAKPDNVELRYEDQAGLADYVGRTIMFEARHGFSLRSHAHGLISAPPVAPVKAADVIGGAKGSAGGFGLPPGSAKTVKDVKKAAEVMKEKGKKAEKP